MARAEVLGEEPARRPLPRAALPLLLAVLLLLGLGDAAARRAESARLLDAVVAGQETARYAERRVAATAEYAGPSLTSSRVDPQVRADLRDLVRREARGQVPGLRAALDRVRRVPVLPWHGEVRRARASYAAHLALLGDHLAAVEEDLARLYRRPPALRAAAVRARDELARTLPAERVARLLP